MWPTSGESNGECGPVARGPSRRLSGRSALLAGALAAVLAGAGPASGPDSIADRSFKATHNSFEKPDPISYQIAATNAWGVELDVCYQGSPSFWQVKHPQDGNCGTPQSLEALLDQIETTVPTDWRVTFLWLDVKNDFGCCGLDAGWLSSLKAIVTDHLGSTAIYSRSDFLADGEVWPSVSQLVSRQKRFVVVVDENAEKPADDLVFVSATSLQQAAQQWPHARFINRAGVSLPSGETPSDDARFLWRGYNVDDSSTYSAALTLGFHLLYTNAYLSSFTMDPRTHAPLPLWAAPSTVLEWGTEIFPFSDLTAAHDRAEPGTTLFMKTGSYPQAIFWSKPMVVETVNGPVTIGP